MRLPPAYTISPEPEPIDWQLLTRLLDSVEVARACATDELVSQFPDREAATCGLTRLKENDLIYDSRGYLLPMTAAIAYRRLEREIFNPHQLRLPL
ncbi:MAG TPA: hypothetical protein VNY27_07015 [Solirubrobacteraceae bacterium]|jgi:hypothetical protein|nr:hypothetical protein [Solirubrobacteraceae bacterium]